MSLSLMPKYINHTYGEKLSWNLPAAAMAFETTKTNGNSSDFSMLTCRETTYIALPTTPLHDVINDRHFRFR